MDVFDREKEAVLCQGLKDYVQNLKEMGFDFSPYYERRFIPFHFGKKFIAWRGGILKELYDFYQGSVFADELETKVENGFSEYTLLDWNLFRTEKEKRSDLDVFAEKCLSRLDPLLGSTYSSELHFLALSPQRLEQYYEEDFQHNAFHPWTERDMFFLLAAADENPKRILKQGESILCRFGTEDTVRLYLYVLVWMFCRESGRPLRMNPEEFFQILYNGFCSARKEEDWEVMSLVPALCLPESCSAACRQVLYILQYSAERLSRKLADTVRGGFRAEHQGGFDFRLTWNLIRLQQLLTEHMDYFLDCGETSAAKAIGDAKKAFGIWNRKNVYRFLKDALLHWTGVQSGKICDFDEAFFSERNWIAPLATAEFMEKEIGLDMDAFRQAVERMLPSVPNDGLAYLFQYAYPRLESFFPRSGSLNRVLQFLRHNWTNRKAKQIIQATLMEFSSEDVCTGVSEAEKEVLRTMENRVKEHLGNV